MGEHYQEKGEYEKALDFFKKSANKGYVIAKVNLAEMLKKGYGTEQNYSEALK